MRPDLMYVLSARGRDIPKSFFVKSGFISFEAFFCFLTSKYHKVILYARDNSSDTKVPIATAIQAYSTPFSEKKDSRFTVTVIWMNCSSIITVALL